MTSTTHEFKTEARQLLDLMINSVYSQKEIFLRELISNASDALDKLRFEALTDENLRSLTEDLHIRLTADKDAHTLTVSDNGIGMSHDDIVNFIGTIAKSGTGEFVKKMKESSSQDLIGQFGVGFYSCFMVADHVELTSRKAGSEEAWKWTSDGKGTYELEESTLDHNGTQIVLHLKKDEKDNSENKENEEADETKQDYTAEWVIRNIVKKYSDFVSYPIKMQVSRSEVQRDENGKPIEGADLKTVIEDETLNSMKAIWVRPESEVKEEEYKDFYKHLSHDWNDPLKWIRFKAEGTANEFTSLLYIPEKPGFDMFMPEHKHGISLYVKRVFIMNDCEELIPDYLRFVKGVVDSENLSLNISREILQQNRQIQVIRKTVVRKVLDAFKKMMKDDRKKYEEFWKNFGSVIKEGLFKDTASSEKIFDCALFSTTASPTETYTLAEYIERMKPEQKNIYFISGDSRESIENSPHIEAFKEKGYEVILLTQPVDEVWPTYASTYKGKTIKSVTGADNELGTEEEQKKTKEDLKKKEEEWKNLLELIKTKLGKYVKEVKLSTKMSTSAACISGEDGTMSPHLEALLRASGKDVPEIKRVLELNPTHPLLYKMFETYTHDAESPKLSDYAELLYGQAVLADGGQLPDPAAFNRKVSELMAGAL